jgi:hypothetical protein
MKFLARTAVCDAVFISLAMMSQLISNDTVRILRMMGDLWGLVTCVLRQMMNCLKYGLIVKFGGCLCYNIRAISGCARDVLNEQRNKLFCVTLPCSRRGSGIQR